MKKILLILVCLISFSTITLAQSSYNLRGFNRALEILTDTVKSHRDQISAEYEKYLKKNTKNIDAEVFQVLGVNDTITLSLVKLYKGSKYDYSIAMLVTMEEIVYEGKEFEKEPCFLAGTYTYESKANGTKTVPMYWSMDYYEYRLAYDFTMIVEKIEEQIRYIKSLPKNEPIPPLPQYDSSNP